MQKPTTTHHKKKKPVPNLHIPNGSSSKPHEKSAYSSSSARGRQTKFSSASARRSTQNATKKPAPSHQTPRTNSTLPHTKSNFRKSAITKKVLSRVMNHRDTPNQYRKEIKKDYKTKKAVFNGQDITAINVDEYFQYEYLYFRDMELTTLDCASLFPNLRVLDLSCNQIDHLDFLQNMPALRHLSISSNALVRLNTLPAELTQLESLALGNNRIQTLEGMPALENLRVLSLQSNLIENLNGLPILFSLDTLDLRENPVVVNLGSKQLKEIVMGIHGFAPLKRVNGEKVQKEAKNQAVSKYGGKIAYCIRDGYLPSAELITEATTNPEAASTILNQASTHLIQQQIEKTQNFPLHLYHIGLTSNPAEGNPISLASIFKLTDHSLNIVAEGFAQHTFESEGSDQEYLVLNGQHVPLDKGMDGKYRATILVPLGEYEYGFTSSMESSPEKQQVITLSETCGSMESEETDLYLFLQWFKLDEHGLFQEIPDANDVSLVPEVSDIGAHVKAQVFCFDSESDMLFSVFDISERIQEAVPQCRSLSIEGDTVEGETLVAVKEYFGGVEGESVFEWVGANDRVVSGPEYPLQLSDVEHRVRLQYTPIREDGVKGQPVTVESETVEPAEPRAVDVRINGELKEGETISVSYTYYGGFQGESPVQWERLNGQTGLYEPIPGENKPEYRLSLSDVHHMLQVRITPTNDKGVTGEDATLTIEEPVLAADPKLSSLAITALKLEEDKIVVVEAEYYGGYEGKSSVEWYRIVDQEKEQHPEGEAPNGTDQLAETAKRVHIPEASQQQMYKCTFDDVGHKLEVEYTPKREDGVAGEPVHVQTDGIIRSGPPKCTAIRIIGDTVQDEKLSVEYEYKGGIEGSSMVRWYRVSADSVKDKQDVEESIENNQANATPITDDDHLHEGELVGKGDEYKISLQDTGYRIRVEYIPVRDDGVQGESVHAFTEVIRALSPHLSNVHITGNFNEYEKVTGSADYFGGYEKERHHKWIRIDEDTDERTTIEDATEDSYIIDTADVGKRLIYAAQPVSTEDVEGEWIESEPSAVIEPQRPTVSVVKITGSPQEDSRLELDVVGEDFDRDLSTVEWFRLDAEEVRTQMEKDDQQNIDTTTGIPLDSPDKWSYTVTLDDVGQVIVCRFTPLRADLNIEGETVTVKTDPVRSGEPSIEDLHLKGKPLEGHSLKIQYVYTGGREGNTRIKWYRVDSAFTREMHEYENATEYNVTVDDLACQIKTEVTPVRHDGVEGLSQSETSAVVRGGAPTVLNLEIEGEAAENKTLRVRYQYYGGLEGESQKRWYRVKTDDQNDKEVVSLNDEYQIQLDDIDHIIQFEYIPVRQDGVKGTPEFHSTLPVRANPATVQNVQISGNAFVSEKLQVSGQYSGGKEGPSIIEWESSISRGGPWTKLAGNGKEFYPTADQLNQFVRARYTPVRQDGVSGDGVESQLVHIHMGSTHLTRLTESVQQSNAVLSQCTPVVTLTNKQMLVSDDSKKPVLKSSYEKGLSIEVDHTDENRFSIMPANGEEIAISTTSRTERDFSALACRLFTGFADASLTEEMYGKPFVQAWKKKKNVGGALETAQSQVSQTERPSEDHMALVYETMSAVLSQDM